MPKLWNQTIEAHRRAVHEAILDTAATLVAERGLRSVTMSEIAEKTGIGRATLYKYFPDVEAILRAWHARRVSSHLEHFAQVQDRPGTPREKLAVVLEKFALIIHETHKNHGHHDMDLVAFLHQDDKVVAARKQLRDMIAKLVAEGAMTGTIRNDVPPDELATYCLHVVTAAGEMSSEAAVRRLIGVTLDGLNAKL